MTALADEPACAAADLIARLTEAGADNEKYRSGSSVRLSPRQMKLVFGRLRAQIHQGWRGSGKLDLEHAAGFPRVRIHDLGTRLIVFARDGDAQFGGPRLRIPPPPARFPPRCFM